MLSLRSFTSVFARRTQQRALSQGVLCRVEGWHSIDDVRASAVEFGAVQNVSVDPRFFLARFPSADVADRVSRELTDPEDSEIGTHPDDDDNAVLHVKWMGRARFRPSKEEWAQLVQPGTIEPKHHSAFVLYEEDDAADAASAEGLMLNGERRECLLSVRLPERSLYIEVPDRLAVDSIRNDLRERGYRGQVRKLDHFDDVLVLSMQSPAQVSEWMTTLAEDDFPYYVFDHTDNRIESIQKSVIIFNTLEMDKEELMARLADEGVNVNNAHVNSHTARLWFNSVADVDDVVQRLADEPELKESLERTIGDPKAERPFGLARKRFLLPRDFHRRSTRSDNDSPNRYNGRANKFGRF